MIRAEIVFQSFRSYGTKMYKILIVQFGLLMRRKKMNGMEQIPEG